MNKENTGEIVDLLKEDVDDHEIDKFIGFQKIEAPTGEIFKLKKYIDLGGEREINPSKLIAENIINKMLNNLIKDSDEL